MALDIIDPDMFGFYSGTPLDFRILEFAALHKKGLTVINELEYLIKLSDEKGKEKISKLTEDSLDAFLEKAHLNGIPRYKMIFDYGLDAINLAYPNKEVVDIVENIRKYKSYLPAVMSPCFHKGNSTIEKLLYKIKV